MKGLPIWKAFLCGGSCHMSGDSARRARDGLQRPGAAAGHDVPEMPGLKG